MKKDDFCWKVSPSRFYHLSLLKGDEVSTDDEGPPEVLGVEKMLVARDSAPSDYLQLFAFLKYSEYLQLFTFLK